jgi:Cu/Ag efflux pump CusA
VLERIVLLSLRLRVLVLSALGVLLAVGAWAAAALPIDALPDVSTIQVSVLTTAPGLSPVEVERTVTVPIENGLNGVPGNVEIRSISRAGLSAVTVIFRDDVDVWFARQLVLERLRTVQGELPPTALTPELAPVSTGLGEIYQFVVRSPQHSPMQLRTLLDWEIVPKLRSVEGVIEVNTMGGDLKQFQVVVDRGRLKSHHMTLDREGVKVGEIYEQQRRFDLRVLNPPSEPTAAAIGDLFVESAGGHTVPLHEVVSLTEGDGPVAVRRQDRARTVRVDVNLRGRDLVSWVDEAKRAVAAKFPMKAGYRVAWGGQFENFEQAQKRLAVVVPVAVAIIFGMLLWMFQNVRFAFAVFVTVPFALTGGMAGLLLRGLSFSLPAAVGFIALGGIAVLNGVVIATEVRKRLVEGAALDDALVGGTAAVVRAVLTTAAVAALGFLPMAVATSAGAEVQRPLATVVIVGIVLGTLVTLLVLPGVLKVALTGWDPHARPSADDEDDAVGDPNALAPAE